MSAPEKTVENVVPTDQVEKPEESTKQPNQEVETKDKSYTPPPPYKPHIPYPQRLKKTKMESQYQKFIKVIEKLHVEIPFTEAITQMPSYAKFLKDILSNKRRLDDPKPLECHSISENKLAKKDKDPGICKRLNLGELQPTKMSLQLADRSVKYPIGILEDIPVKIGQLYIPIDFIVMDIKEDE
ncbi:uncharacterized protein LOC131649322 [Vicia villosa]|uniref:uncharacterized protein LOC131649322 n=1 Tax=Vicia villosa TaxID=3911 RepID=UPI00273B1F94|nr:uncharacterized protein LOC131649322 [Vicia villosa]